MGVSTFNLDVRVFIAQKPGKLSASASLFVFFCYILPSFPIISFVYLLPTALKYHGLPICWKGFYLITPRLEKAHS